MKATWLYFVIALFTTCKICAVTSIDIHKIQLDDYVTPVSLSLNAETEYVVLYPQTNTTNPYRIKTWSDDSSVLFPVLIVVRQARQVTSWKIPTLIETTTKGKVLRFYNVSKTMCHDHMDEITNATSGFSTVPLVISQNFIVAVSTSSIVNVTISIDIEEVTDFYIKPDTNYSVTVSPSSSRYVFYRFDKIETEAVIINIESEDDVCLVVSVQNHMCPVFDNNRDVKYEGTYETINRKGALTIKHHKYRYGFFLVFVAKPDNYECSRESSVLLPKGSALDLVTSAPTNDSSEVSFMISNGITKHQYLVACLAIMAILVGFGVIFTVISLIFNRFGTISRTKFEPIKIRDFIQPLTEDEISKILEKDSLTVDVFAKYPKRIRKRSYNYLAHTLSIALFYSIPVIQLVVTYQRVVNVSGNLDLCYYNFLCAHPALGFSDFNHIFSNIGYILIGFFFIFVVIDRHTMIKITKDLGIPVHYGLFHAMGVALIIEGVLSACYHICPSQANYQFDTSFMYIMAVLIMVKLYQNRHPDINATAYSTFTVLGLAIFLATIGILQGSLTVWVIFFISYSTLLVILSLKIYYVSFVFNGFKQLKSSYQLKGVCKEMLHPVRKGRFILLLIINLTNLSMLGVGLWLYKTGSTDFGTFLLGLLMGNTVIHCTFYTVMKLLHKEIICFESIIYGVLSIICWGASGVFFLDAATLWTVSPAESRQWNQGCILFDFYDKHDVWHFLSAPALYFTFMFLMYLDDDIAHKKQSEIPVF